MNTIQSIPMRELEKLTGLSRTMINFYIREGLLPIPEKSAKNMAYYDERFIKKLQLIQKLKNAGIPLAQIKQILNNENDLVDVDPLLDSMKSINKLFPLLASDDPVTIEQIMEAGIEKEIIDGLIKLYVILPIDSEKHLFPADSITICRLTKYFYDYGMPLGAAKDFIHELRKVIDVEIHAFKKYIKDASKELSQDEQAPMIVECIENINTLLPLLHMQLIKSEIQKMK